MNTTTSRTATSRSTTSSTISRPKSKSQSPAANRQRGAKSSLAASSKSGRSHTKTSTAASKATSKASAELRRRAERLLETELDFISNDSFVGRRDSSCDLSPLASEVESSNLNAHELSAGLPTHLARMCATPLLTQEQEQELFRRMNFCKYKANVLRSRLSRTRPNAEKVAEIEGYIARAERLRNYIIQANTRLVMSIARRFADGRNGFDDLLSQGVASLMHSVEKFDYGRGYRFSTYATCAVRRDLYRLVMGRKKDFQRFTTGTDEYLSGCADEVDRTGEMTEAGWDHLTGSISEMLKRLDDRERFIVTHRFGLDESGQRSSYSRLGERLGISKERVRQLANRALEKLREWAPEHRLEALLS